MVQKETTNEEVKRVISGMPDWVRDARDAGEAASRMNEIIVEMAFRIDMLETELEKHSKRLTWVIKTSCPPVLNED